ncbi:hypothetical protein MMC26_001027 [Xylographa opegraphella]|nr:hypothetical protein [Xylographa opegraphella]
MSQKSSYFAGFVGFVPDPRSSLEAEFSRLVQHQQWLSGSSKHAKERRKCVLAEYDFHLGSIEVSGKLDAWQRLCKEVGIRKPPASITQCKKVLHGVHINLVDLVSSRREGTNVRRFSNAEELRAYTLSEDKIFPKKKAKTDGLIKIFLRGIF